MGNTVEYRYGQIWFSLYSSNTNALKVYTATPNLNDNFWHHCVVTYDGSSLPTGIKIYIDGVNESLSVQYNNLHDTIMTTTNFTLATRIPSGLYFPGSLDEIAIYDKELTPEEVAFRWNSGNGTESMKKTVPPPIRETILCNWDKTTSVYSRTISRFGVWTQMVTAIKNAFNNFTTSGFLFLHNDNTEWEDCRVAVNNVKVPTVKNPDWTPYKGGLILSLSLIHI